MESSQLFLDSLSPLRPFQNTLVDDVIDILTRFKKTYPEDYLKTLLILPSRKTVKAVKIKLANQGQSTILLPHIVSLQDLPQHILGIQEDIHPAHDRLALAYKLCSELQQDNNEPASFSLAKNLVDIVDQIQSFTVDVNRLDELVPEIYAEHWQHTSQFLKNFVNKWTEQNQLRDGCDPRLAEIQQMNQLSSFWDHCPPRHPVIVIGLDGFLPYINTLLKSVAKQEQGYIFWSGILSHSGFDKESLFSDASRDIVKATHPNYLYSQHAHEQNSLQNSPTDRDKVLSHIFSDIPFDERSLSPLSMDGLSIFRASTLAKESEMVALLAREILEHPQKSVAIVSPDEHLSTQITKDLVNWGIKADRQRELSALATKEARYILRVLDLNWFHSDPLATLVVLKDPLTTYSDKQSLVQCEGDFRNNHFEQKVKGDDFKKWNEVVSPFLSLRHFDASAEKPFNSSSKEKLDKSAAQGICFSDLVTAFDTLCRQLSSHLIASDLYQTLLEKLHGVSSSLTHLPFQEFRQLIIILLHEQMQIDAESHPRVYVLTPLQAAFSSFDRIILAGLNEGIWPASPKENPWLNLDMQQKLGFPDSQALIGRGAWLLAQNMRAPEVFLTYSNRRKGTPAFPSRWILRMQALEIAIRHSMDSSNCKENYHTFTLNKRYETYIKHINQPKSHAVAKEPHPKPVLERRPKKYTISDIERLIKDPYQIYAKKILGLEPCEDLTNHNANISLEPAYFGTFVHGCLENCVRNRTSFTSEADRHLKKLETRQIDIPSDSYSKNHMKNQWDLPFGLPPLSRHVYVLWRSLLKKQAQWIDDYLSFQNNLCESSELELMLTTTLKTQPHNIDIVGKADRIDVLRDGSFEIIDYKTGMVPTKKDILSFRSPQLPLLAKLYQSIVPSATISKLTYVGIGDQKIMTLDLNTPELRTVVEDTWAFVKDLILYFHQPDTTFSIEAVQSLSDPYNAYTHLERTAEWIEPRNHSKKPEEIDPEKNINEIKGRAAV